MDKVKYVKSFSHGQITIPKEFRDLFGIQDEFWLKLTVDNNKIIAEPVESKVDKKSYQKKLLSIKGDWINPEELKRNREQMEKQIRERAL